MPISTATQYLYAVTLSLCGLAAGWFLNILVWRWPLGMKMFSPSSLCPRCGAGIRRRDNIPIIGFILLGGRCRNCDGRIHPRYPVVELATAILWGVAGWKLAQLSYHPVIVAGLGVLVLSFITAMMAVLLVDWDTHTIPDAITHGGIIISLAVAPIFVHFHHAETAEAFSRHHPFLAHLLPGQHPWQHGIAAALAGLLAGFGFTMLVRALGWLVFRRQALRSGVDSVLGIGDVKLMAFIGAFLGWRSVFAVFASAAIMGAVAGTILKLLSGNSRGRTGWRGLWSRWESGTSLLPFGPFLAAGAILDCFSVF